MQKITALVCAPALMMIASAAAQVVTVAKERVQESNELDLLSRNAQDPFPQLTDSQVRTPLSVTIRALNKITAQYIDIEAPMEEIASFGTLEIVPRFCDKRPPEEFPETTAFLQIYDLGVGDGEPDVDDSLETPATQTDGDTGGSEDALPVLTEPPVGDAFSEDTLGDLSDGDKVFSGWMFASSPALNALEHPVYDIWVIDCKTVVADK